MWVSERCLQAKPLHAGSALFAFPTTALYGLRILEGITLKCARCVRLVGGNGAREGVWAFVRAEHWYGWSGAHLFVDPTICWGGKEKEVLQWNHGRPISGWELRAGSLTDFDLFLLSWLSQVRAVLFGRSRSGVNHSPRFHLQKKAVHWFLGREGNSPHHFPSYSLGFAFCGQAESLVVDQNFSFGRRVWGLHFYWISSTLTI